MAKTARETKTVRPAVRTRKPARVPTEKPASQRRRARRQLLSSRRCTMPCCRRPGVRKATGLPPDAARGGARPGPHAAPTIISATSGSLSELAAIALMFNAAWSRPQQRKHPRIAPAPPAYVAYAQVLPDVQPDVPQHGSIRRGCRCTRPLRLHSRAWRTGRPAGSGPRVAGRRRSTRLRRSRAPGRWCTVLPCCCSTGA